MIRVTVLYPRTSDTHFDMDYYLNKHIPMVKARAKEIGVGIGIEVDEGLGTITPGDPAPYLIVGFMNFEKIDDFQSLVTQHGPELIGDVSNFTDIPWQMQIGSNILN